MPLSTITPLPIEAFRGWVQVSDGSPFAASDIDDHIRTRLQAENRPSRPEIRQTPNLGHARTRSDVPQHAGNR